ncbi:MAG: flagellar motor protein MotB [Nitrospiraceae bacterium]
MSVMNMIRRYNRTNLVTIALGLLVLATTSAGAQDAQSVKWGEPALQFAAGSIRKDTPQDGVVNFITGDNQTTGNRMILGWRDTDILYLRLARPQETAIGDLFTIYRRVHKVFHPRTKEYMGYLVTRTGVVRVIENDSPLTMVQIVRTYSSVSPGDPVMKFAPNPMEEPFSEVRVSAGAEGMIIDLQSDKNMSLVGQGNVVYLDQGRAHGIHAGDRLDVFRIGGALPRRKVGELKVISCEDRTATAIIARSTSRVFVGDRVRHRDRGTLEELHSDEVVPDMQGDSPSVAHGPKTAKSDGKVRLEPIQGGARINLEDLVDQLEYESGEVRIKPAGLPVLERIAEYLKIAAIDKHIRVEGHADNMEIGPTLRSAFPSNWELSKARAAGIVRHLVENGGLDSAKLSSVGYAASRPVASNATEEGRKHNRRIEVVLYDEAPLEAQKEAKEAVLSPIKTSTVVVTPASPSSPFRNLDAQPNPNLGDQSVTSGAESGTNQGSTTVQGSSIPPDMPVPPSQ